MPGIAVDMIWWYISALLLCEQQICTKEGNYKEFIRQLIACYSLQLLLYAFNSNPLSFQAWICKVSTPVRKKQKHCKECFPLFVHNFCDKN